MELNAKGSPGAVLYARDAPDLSNGKSTLEISTDSMGQVFAKGPFSNEVDGVSMHAVGRIKMIHAAGGRGWIPNDLELGYGFFFLGADGTFHEKADLFFDQTDVFFQHVRNGNGDTVAYRTVDGKQYYVAAGVDVVLIIALTAMAELANKLRSGSIAPGGAGAGAGMAMGAAG